jgi:hypothetical protein
MELKKIIITGGLALAGLAILAIDINEGMKLQTQREKSKPSFHKVADNFGENNFAGIGITTADMDSDGDLDILIAGPKEIKYLENQGNNRYANPVKIADNFGENKNFTGIGITTADMDSDGDLDILIAGPKEIKYLENQGQFR